MSRRRRARGGRRGRRSAGRWRLPRALSRLARITLLLAAVPAFADLVWTTDGGLLRVEGYQVDGDWAHLRLDGQGLVVVPLSKIERIVDEEVAVGTLDRRSVGGIRLVFRDGDPVPATPYGELIWAAARRTGLNPELVAAVARAESAFDPAAVSPKGARGLLQVMPATGRRFDVDPDDLFDPAINLDAGTRYLAWLAQRYPGDPARILAAYNAGEVNVDEYGGVPPFRETRDYLRRIGAALR